MMRTGLQFDRAEYEADMVSLAEMTPEEVVAMLLRNSLGFSRCTKPAFARAGFAVPAHIAFKPLAHIVLVLQVHTGVSASNEQTKSGFGRIFVS